MELHRLEGLRALPLAVAGFVLSMGGLPQGARAADSDLWSASFSGPHSATASTFTPVVMSSASDFWSAWAAVAEQPRATQPWSSLLVTTSGMLEQRVRFDVSELHAGNGANPATGEAIKIKASKKVAFRAAKDLKMAI